jgi:transposase-like protein
MPCRLPAQEALRDVLFDEEGCIRYLIDKEIILKSICCAVCSGRMTLRQSKKIYRCTTHLCRKEKSIRTNSFFANSKLPFRKIMQIAYHWLLKTPNASIIAATSCDSHTITSFIGYFRQLVGESLDDEDSIIGGNNVIVEIDESKLGKRKYHRGHRVDGLWVLGGIERTPNKKVFLLEVPNRSAETLLSVITAHVAPGSIIMTDLWKAYSNLESLGFGYRHLTVNHSKQFFNPKNGCCTNTIEGLWNGLKLSVKPRQRTSKIAPGCFLEYIWRKKNKENLWEGLLSALKETAYPNIQ